MVRRSVSGRSKERTDWRAPDDRQDGPAASAPTQALSRRDRACLALSLLGWALLAWLAFDMGHPLAQLTMPMSPHWSAANLLAVVRDVGGDDGRDDAAVGVADDPDLRRTVPRSRRARALAQASSAAYLLVWFAFSAAATARAMGCCRP